MTPKLLPRHALPLFVAFLPAGVLADEAASVADLAAKAKPSVAVVTFAGRDGTPAGIGTGFVVDPAGLVATNLHVIGEARPITVRLGEKDYPVSAVEATDRAADLAVLKIDAKDLPVLPLGDSKAMREGQDLVALGHPRGLEHSVVRGVLSGRREIDGRELLQLAIPVEPGNSGGPVLDLRGRVVGLMTMKSAVTDNLGFAVPIESLKPLLDQPNPVPIDRWLTIGRLDPKAWTPLFGGNWRQRAGRIDVDGPGAGFGGRTLLLSTQDVPAPPYELAVTVKLGDESGAAGLVFGSDGDERHFGFYPSSGALRLSRFDGPDVFSWQVLEQVPSKAYRPGEWNTIRVRVEPDKVTGFVNDAQVTELAVRVPPGKVGLAAFRGTKAEFKRFRVGKEIESDTPTDEVKSRVLASLDDLDPDRPPRGEDVDALLKDADAAPDLLEAEARRLERKAARVRQLAAAVPRRKVLDELKALGESESPDLLRGALLLAKLDNPEVDVASYLDAARRLADEAKALAPADARERDRLAALDRLLFEQLGFHGSRTNYYHRSNSYLNEVIDDREGLPVALSVLYIDLAKRLGLTVEGVGLPGHFIVRFVPKDGEPELIDVFDRGKRITRADAEKRAGEPLSDDAFAAVGTADVLDRMLRNLLNLARSAEDSEATLRYTEAALALRPGSAADRLTHAFVCVNTSRFDEALADCDRLLGDAPEGLDLSRVSELRSYVERRRRESEEQE
jgi:regulator of sirC expression with transglutaminase-like and TPR domain